MQANSSFKIQNFQVFVQTRHISDMQSLKRAPASGISEGERRKGYYMVITGMQFGKLVTNEHANALALILLLRST